MGLRKATPLFPCLGILYSSWTSKLAYSFSVMSQPPPPPFTKRIPFSAPQNSIFPPSLTFQPVRSLPLKSGSNPSPGLSSARSEEERQGRATVHATKEIQILDMVNLRRSGGE